MMGVAVHHRQSKPQPLGERLSSETNETQESKERTDNTRRPRRSRKNRINANGGRNFLSSCWLESEPTCGKRLEPENSHNIFICISLSEAKAQRTFRFVFKQSANYFQTRRRLHRSCSLTTTATMASSPI